MSAGPRGSTSDVFEGCDHQEDLEGMIEEGDEEKQEEGERMK